MPERPPFLDLRDVLDVLEDRVLRRVRKVEVGTVSKFTETGDGPLVEVEISRPMVDEKGRTAERAPIPSVPIIYPSFGAFSVWGPLEVGDEVLLLIADRSIAEWLEVGGPYTPKGPDKVHDVADCLALPLRVSKPKRGDLKPGGSFHIGRRDGSQTISFSVSGTQVTIEGPQIGLGAAALDAASKGTTLNAAIDAMLAAGAAVPGAGGLAFVAAQSAWNLAKAATLSQKTKVE